MRRGRLRLRLWWVMLAVAVMAAVFAGLHLWHMANFYRWKVRYHGQMERSSIIAVVEGPNSADPAELGRLSRLWSAHHTALRRKYEQAAARPWRYVAPDPEAPVPLSGPGRRVDLHFGD